MIGLCLKFSNHKHVIYPKPSLPGIVFLLPATLLTRWILGHNPLTISIFHPKFIIPLFRNSLVNLKRNCSEYIEIHDIMSLRKHFRQKVAVRREQWFEPFDKSIVQSLVIGCLSEPQRAEPCAHVGIGHKFHLIL